MNSKNHHYPYHWWKKKADFFFFNWAGKSAFEGWKEEYCIERARKLTGFHSRLISTKNEKLKTLQNTKMSRKKAGRPETTLHRILIKIVCGYSLNRTKPFLIRRQWRANVLYPDNLILFISIIWMAEFMLGDWTNYYIFLLVSSMHGTVQQPFRCARHDASIVGHLFLCSLVCVWICACFLFQFLPSLDVLHRYRSFIACNRRAVCIA